MNQKNKIAAVTPLIKPGAVKANTLAIINAVNKARDKGAVFAVLPSECITGDIGDMRGFPAVQKATLWALSKIAGNTGIPLVLGFSFGKLSLAAFIQDNKVRGVSVLNKKSANRESEELLDFPFGITDSFILKDGSKEGARLLIAGDSVLEESPRWFDETDIIAVPAAYPALMGGFEAAKSKARKLSFRNNGCIVALSCAGAGESTYKYVRAGDKIIAGKGAVLAASAGDLTDIVIGSAGKESKRAPSLDAPEIPSFIPSDTAEVWDILARGIYGRMRESGNSRVILGLSGGLDSACALIAAVNAFDKYNLPRKDIIAVSMPGAPTTERTKNNARTLAQRLGVLFFELPIAQAVRRHLRKLAHTKKDVVYENAQSRERAKILLDMAGKHGALMLGTCNMTESALGFNTYGGDRLSHFNPLSGLTKSAVRALAADYVKRLKKGDGFELSNENVFTTKEAPADTHLVIEIEGEPCGDSFDAGDELAINKSGGGGEHDDSQDELVFEESEAEQSGNETDDEEAEEENDETENSDAEESGAPDNDAGSGYESAESCGDILTSLVDCLSDILDTPVSPELKKGQETEKILGPFPLHEFFLLRLLAYRESKADILQGAFKAFPKMTAGEVRKFYKLFIGRFFKNRFKGLFASDGIRLTPYDLDSFEIPWNFSKDLWE